MNFPGAPIILRFNLSDNLKDCILSNLSKSGKLIFEGFRPLDSLEMHKEFSNKNSYLYKQPSLGLSVLSDLRRKYCLQSFD